MWMNRSLSAAFCRLAPRLKSAVVKNAVVAPRIRSLLASTGAVVSASGASALPETYAIDPVHTHVMFSLEHAGFSRAFGTVSGATGTLRFDETDWRNMRLDVTVPLGRLNLSNTSRVAGVVAARLLETKRYPEAHFISRTAMTNGTELVRLCGDLTLHGMTGPLCMDVTFNAREQYGQPQTRPIVNFSATASISRKEFGIGGWSSLIGDNVQLFIEAAAAYSQSGTPSQTPPATGGTTAESYSTAAPRFLHRLLTRHEVDMSCEVPHQRLS